MRPTRPVFMWHAWIDNGESWTRADLPAPDTVIEAASTAQQAAEEAYSRLKHRADALNGIAFVLKAVNDPAVGTEKPFWLVRVEPRPMVVDVKATTLTELCEDDNVSKNPPGSFEYVKNPGADQVCLECGVTGDKHNLRHPFRVRKAPACARGVS